MSSSVLVADLTGHLRTLIEQARGLTVELEVGLGAAERVAGEREACHAQLAALEERHRVLSETHDGLRLERETILGTLAALRTEHETFRQALADLREQHQELIRERQRTADELESLVRRLRP